MDRQSDTALPSAEQWTSLAALILILLFAGAADGLMEALGPVRFLMVGASAMGLSWALVEVNG